ncbi:YicC/YloC family endoribonuclease, partial [Ramlibacter sp.]|uniref:YicC/YloC family endoribonuclease n=1 Tax=Ramlibacter sp. TaxID=1917967 RepID=UPI0035AF3E3A
MAVYSMTGYASVQQGTTGGGAEAGANIRIGLEIRSVNSRFLDLAFRLGDELRAHEPALRELITGRLKRGKVEVRGGIERVGGQSVPVPGPETLDRLASAQAAVQARLPEARPLSVADALRLTAGAESAATEDFTETLAALAARALTDLMAAREREGARLAQMLLSHLGQLRALATQAAPLVPQLVEQQRQRFLERWKEAMALGEGQATPEAAQDRAL